MKIKLKNVTKRVLAFFCAFVMSFGAVTLAATGSGKGITELSDKELYEIELLNAIGIYDGVDSIEGKESFVRRDVMAYLAARIMGMSNVTHAGESLFGDVDKSNFAYNAINVLAQMNIVKGNSKGNFEPTKDITLDEASEIVLRIMGYSKLLDADSSIKSELVQKHKLHKGITYAKDKRLQVKYLSVLLYNTLTADFPQVVYMSGGGFDYQIEKGETLLSESFDVYPVEGIITANVYTSTDIITDTGRGMVKIGDLTYNVGNTDADKYVGYYVTAFYRQGDEDTLICIDVDSNNTVVVLEGDDIEYKNFQYTIYEKSRKKTYNVSKALNLIYNGKAIYYDKNKMIPKYGTITLVNNNKDSAYDTVIITSVENFVVGGYGASTNVIQSKYDKDFIDLNKYDERLYSIHKADGKTYKLTSLKEWDILSIIESDDGKYLDITVSTESVSGMVERTFSSDGSNALTIDGVDYEVAITFFENSNYDITIGYSGTFYLDMYGRIAAANGRVEQLKWGYLINARRNNEDGSDNYSVKLLTQDSGKVIRTETADKLFVNDVKYTSSNINSLNLSGAQVIRYNLDRDGKIKKIYTVGNDFVRLAASSSRGFVSNVFVSNQIMDIAVNSNTVFLQIPNNAASDDITDEDFYGVMTLDNFIRDGWYTVSAYGFEEEEIVAPLVLVERYTSNAATPSGTYMVVSDIKAALDKDNMPVDKIIGYDINKNKVELLTKELGRASAMGIEEGDFFAMVLYPDKSIQRAVQLYDYKSGAFNSDYKARDYNQTNFARWGYAYDISSGFLMLSDNATSLVSRKVLNTSSANVLIFNSQLPKEKISVGTISDIETYKRSGNAARVVFFGTNSVPRAIVCYQ